MKIAAPLLALFLGQQAAAFAPIGQGFSTSTALNYKINESEKFEKEQLTETQDLNALRKVLSQEDKPSRPEPQVGGLKKFDLAAAKKARVPKHTGAVRGAFKSLAGSQAVKSIQGGKCLKTWNIMDNNIDRVSVMLNNEGVPLSAAVEVWQGPASTPMRLQVASDDGFTFPFSAVLETPNTHNSIAVKNMSPMEFAMGACVVADVEDAKAGGNKQAGQGAVVQALAELGEPFVVHGQNGLESFQFEETVESVQVYLETDGRPLHARVELIMGPDDNKQVIDVMSENGLEQPFFAVIDTPSLPMGGGATVRVVNTAPSTVFPLTAMVEPYLVTDDYVPPAAPKVSVDKSEDLFFLSNDDDDDNFAI